jgi:hypothetical protein
MSDGGAKVGWWAAGLINFFHTTPHMKKLTGTLNCNAILSAVTSYLQTEMSSSVPLPSLPCWRCQQSFRPVSAAVFVCAPCAVITNKVADAAVKHCRVIEDQVRAELGSPLRKRARRVFEAQCADLDL